MSTRAGKIFRRAGLALLLVFVAAQAWGYWHASTHAWLGLQLRDVARQWPAEGTRVELLGESGVRLAEAVTAGPYGQALARHPRLGDCTQVHGKAYGACHAEYSAWTSDWAKDVRYVRIRLGDCVLPRIPVTPQRSKTGWGSWWVPLPHVGGTPIESVVIRMAYDSRHCARAG